MAGDFTDDSQLWQSLKKGDRDSLASIYNLYFNNLYEYGLRLNSESDLVKDCIHDLFVKLWINRENLGQVTNLKSYLLVALRGTMINKTKQLKKTSLREWDENDIFEMSFSVEKMLIEKEDSTEKTRKLSDALNNLSARQKEIIYLKYLEEMDYEDIALIMNITIKGAYKLSGRAIEALRSILNMSKPSLLVLLAILKDELFPS